MKKYTKRTVNYYNSIANDYFKSNAAKVVKDKIDCFINLLPGKKVLDVACGTGHDTDYLTKKGFDCLGIDLSRKMIEIAKKNFEGKFEIMDFFNLRFRDNSFDKLWCSSVFVHVAKNDLPKLLMNLKKILKNNGLLGIITVKKQKIIRNKGDSRIYVMYGKRDLEGYLKKSGYQILVSTAFIHGGKKRLFIICKNKKMTKDTFRLNRRKIRVAISPFCNLNCLYCDGSKSQKRGRFGLMEDFRQRPLSQGIISADVFIKIIEALHLVGFSGMTLTGGEPLLNPEWDEIIKISKKVGISQICLTTNGTLLNSYLQKKSRLPEELTLLTISLHSFNAKEFEFITGGAKLKQIIDGLRVVKKSNPKLEIRANKVVIRRGLKSLPDYIKLCEKSGVIDQINLLNLILKEPKDRRNKEFFEKQFVSASEIIDLLSKKAEYHFSMDDKYEFRTKTPKGLWVIIKDTNLTLRNAQCDKCPIYCQEGFYTIRVASDGTIRTCIDYRNKLPFIDGPLELKRGTLVKELQKIMKMFANVEVKETLEEFFKKYSIKKTINSLYESIKKV